MNVFRILGDLSHLLAMILLLGKIWRSKCCTGISGKSQILFALVFTTRYLDLFTNFISIYNTVMKVVFLLCAYVTVYMIYGKFRKTFDIENDTFRLEFLLVPVIGLSFLENYSFTPLEILWTFSIYLESVAILPQLFMISKTGEAETITTHYLFFLGLYRALYLANWIRRYQTENFYDQIAVVSGVVQTIFYCDFFYLYVTKGSSNTRGTGNKQLGPCAQVQGFWVPGKRNLKEPDPQMDRINISTTQAGKGQCGAMPTGECPTWTAILGACSHRLHFKRPNW
ncbi:ER lumen protein-retaining receptor 3 [Sciurus carolinensis]|uniref:ER lumen protein-retaining receptor n=1 Tax=Sciurus carolinensis TaxID=30640 RepID=A0AA41MIV6_SCICA|nr:ER lumen protein-retaining receptor 3 [Sciurus carolinensis]